MKHVKKIALLVVLAGIFFQSYAQTGRGPMSTTVTGHMCVTLLSPAAVSSVQNLNFNNVALRSATSTTSESVSLVVPEENMQMGSIRVQGNKSTFAVTTNRQRVGFSQSGNNISVENISATSNTDANGSSTISIGATMHINKTVVGEKTSEEPLTVMVNFN